MKTSISNELTHRRQDRSWTKAAARRLRDWLNGFLEEGVDTTEDDAQAFEGNSLSSSALTPDVEGEEQAVGGVSRDEQLIDPLLASLFEPAGPPEEWLKIVREGAPQLLLPAERGGTPWRGSPTMRTRIEMHMEKRVEATEEGPQQNSPAKTARIEGSIEIRGQATADRPAVPSSSSNPSSLKASPKRSEEPQVLTPSSPRSAAPTASTWIQRLKQRLAPGVVASQIEHRKGRASLSTEPVHPKTEKHHARESEKQISAKHSAASRSRVAQPLPSSAAGNRVLVTPQALPASPSKPRVERTSPTAPANRTTPQKHLETIRLGTDFPRNARSVTPTLLTASNVASTVRRVSGETDLAASRPPVRSTKIEETSVTPRRIDNNFAASSPNIEPLISRPNRAQSPDTRVHPAIKARKTKTGKDLNGAAWSNLPATRLIENSWSRVSQPKPEAPEYENPASIVHEQERYRDDPWPDLPESQPTLALGWTPELRGERLLALDLEQRGGS